MSQLLPDTGNNCDEFGSYDVKAAPGWEAGRRVVVVEAGVVTLR